MSSLIDEAIATTGANLVAAFMSSKYVFTMQAFVGGKPAFEAIDGSGIAIGERVAATGPTPTRSGDGGLGSVGDVLLQVSGQGSLRCAAYTIAYMTNDEHGHSLCSNL